MKAALYSPSRRTGAGYDPAITPLAPAATSVAVAGDWGGQIQWARKVVREVAGARLRTIVHLGDLGVLMPGRLGNRFTINLEQNLEENDVRLVLVDGNHDAHPRLRRAPFEPASGFRRLGARLWWTGRGTSWSWAGRRLGALGGAYSVDRARLTEGFNLWSLLEEPTEEEAERLRSERLDVLFSHDAPAGVPLTSWLRLRPAALARANRTRELLDGVVAQTQPAVLFHGHWHQAGVHWLSAGTKTTAYSLANEWSPENVRILDLSTLEVRDLPTV